MLKTILLILVSVLVSYFTTLTFQHKGNDIKKEENGYHRVIRTGVIRCGYLTWPPFLTVDPNTKKMKGPTYDYMEEIGKVLGLKIEWVEEIGIGELVEALNANRFDVMCMSVWPEEAKLKNTTMTLPVFYSAVFPVVRQNDNRFDKSFSSMNNPDIKVAVIDADTSLSIALKKLPKAKLVSLPQSSDSSHLMETVATGKADLTFLDEGVVYDYNQHAPKKLKLISIYGPTKVFPEVLTVKQGEIELKGLIDSAIVNLEADNFAAGILRPYHISSYPPNVPYDLYFRDKLK